MPLGQPDNRTCRTWRFLIPPDESEGSEESDEALEVGLTVAPTGAVATVGDEEAIRQAILLLLATSTGERVMRPDYGCELHKLVFSPNDDTTAGLAIHYVRQALDRWEPRIEVLRIDAGRRLIAFDGGDTAGEAGGGAGGTDAGDRLYVGLEYRVRATRRVDRVSVSLNLGAA